MENSTAKKKKKPQEVLRLMCELKSRACWGTDATQRPDVVLRCRLCSDRCKVFVEQGQFLECTRVVYYIHVHKHSQTQIQTGTSVVLKQTPSGKDWRKNKNCWNLEKTVPRGVKKPIWTSYFPRSVLAAPECSGLPMTHHDRPHVYRIQQSIPPLWTTWWDTVLHVGGGWWLANDSSGCKNDDFHVDFCL